MTYLISDNIDNDKIEISDEFDSIIFILINIDLIKIFHYLENDIIIEIIGNYINKNNYNIISFIYFY